MTTETTVPTPQDLLIRAADIIGERGWAQGDYINEDGCVCAVGAIHTAVAEYAGIANVQDILDGDVFLSVEVSSAAHLARAIAAENVGFPSLVEWNDVEGRTADEVVAVLRAAAEEAK